MGFFRSEFSRWGIPIEHADARDFPGLTGMDPLSRALLEKHLRRGVLLARTKQDQERTNYFMSPGELMQHRFQMGQLLIGKLGDVFLGHMDDRPMVLIAGTRAGKTSTILKQNLYLYSGSMLVLDPKGDLAKAAAVRRAMGHNVYVLDHFGQTGERSACFNPLAELNPDDPAIVDDVMSITNALVPDEGGGGSGSAKFFNDSARALINGIILVTLSLPPSERHLVTVRELLCLTYPSLAAEAKRLAAAAMSQLSKGQKKQYFSANNAAIMVLLNKMATLNTPYARVAASIANRLSETPPETRGGIFATAAVHTDFLDSLLMAKGLLHSDFKLSGLRGNRPTTIFLCLPVGRMEQHFRWLRLIVQLACSVLERMGTYPLGRPPILFMLEEFAALGHMSFMERASAYFPEFGIKPWFILQDITQLKTHYKSWESFLGNAGLMQLFANGDGETLDYICRRLGKLMAPWEVETAFARENQSQLLLMKGRPPASALRLSHDDVEQIRTHMSRLVQTPIR